MQTRCCCAKASFSTSSARWCWARRKFSPAQRELWKGFCWDCVCEKLNGVEFLTAGTTGCEVDGVSSSFPIWGRWAAGHLGWEDKKNPTAQQQSGLGHLEERKGNYSIYLMLQLVCSRLGERFWWEVFNAWRRKRVSAHCRMPLPPQQESAVLRRHFWCMCVRFRPNTYPICL